MIGSDMILWMITLHKYRSRAAHQIEKIRNQTVYWQLSHDISHSLGNLELKLCDRSWMKNVRFMTSIHDLTMGGVATSFMWWIWEVTQIARFVWPTWGSPRSWQPQVGPTLAPWILLSGSWPVQFTNTVLFMIQHGLDMPCLTGVCMWLTSLTVYVNTRQIKF